MSTAATSTNTLQQRQKTLARPRRSNIAPVSTPNLHTLYSAHSRLGALGRKASSAALTSGSLAAIPDDSESYAISSVLSETTSPPHNMATTPSRAEDNDVVEGDAVDVPGNMSGTVRFIGSVNGRKGTFAGVELHPDFAARGKNNGDVDG
jgi:hypothetical protein